MKLRISLYKCLLSHFLVSLYRRWIGEAPMRSHRLSRPDGAGFRCCLIANGKHKVHERRAGPGKLAPIFAAEPFCRNPILVQKLQRKRVDSEGRMAACAERFKFALPERIEDRLRHDAARRIARA